MVHYKLTYFPARAYAEPIRQMFAVAGVEYENVIVDRTDGTWEKAKADTPFGCVPVLEVDGFKIPQSGAIARYLAKKFNLVGKTAEESAWCDAIVDQFKDFFTAFVPVIVAMRTQKTQEEIAKIRKEVSQPAVDSWFKIIKELLEKSKSGYLVGDGLTWADLVVADNLTTLANLKFYDGAVEKKLGEYQDRINSADGLKQWLEKRPFSDI